MTSHKLHQFQLLQELHTKLYTLPILPQDYIKAEKSIYTPSFNTINITILDQSLSEG
jgi:hypothetical protein